MEKYLSVSEYARIHHKDTGNIRRMLSSGRMEGEKVGKQWIIPASAVYPADQRIVTGKYVQQRKRTDFYQSRELFLPLRRMIKDLRNIYGNVLEAVVLYGSYARGEADDESDVDIALFVKESSISLNEKMIECVSGYELETGKVLSVIDIEQPKFDMWKNALPFYKNIEKDGIVLWKAA